MIKNICPPLLYRALIKSYLKFRSRPPRWQTVKSGPLKDASIFVAPQKKEFDMMVAGTYDTFFWEYLKSFNMQGKTILDIGAHIGYHTMCFATLTGPEGQVFAFEPNPYNCERLQMHIEKNLSLKDRISLQQIALSNACGQTQFNFSKNVNQGTSSGGYIEGSHCPLAEISYKNANFISAQIEMQTLDEFVNISNTGNISLMKIDVEGAEHNVLQGGMDTLKRSTPLILMEVHAITAMLHVTQILDSLNYRIKILDDSDSNRCFIAAEPRNK